MNAVPGAWALLTLDAHHDCRPATDGSRNGTPVRELIEAGLPGERVAQIGIHPLGNAREHADWARAQGIHIVPLHAVRRDGMDAVIAIDAVAAGGAWGRARLRRFRHRRRRSRLRAGLPGEPSRRDAARRICFRAAHLLGADPHVVAADLCEVDANADVNAMTAAPDGRHVSQILQRARHASPERDRDVSAVVVHGIGALCTCDPLRRRCTRRGARRGAGRARRGHRVRRPRVEPRPIRTSRVERSRSMLAAPPSCPGSSMRTRTSSGSVIAATSTRDEPPARPTKRSRRSGGGIRATVRATAAGSVDELATAGRDRARRMLADGTTTVEVKSGYGLEHDAEMRQLDAAGPPPRVGGPARRGGDLSAAARGPGRPARRVHRRRLHPGRGRRGEARAVSSTPSAKTGAYTVAECERLFTAARAHGLRPKIHAEQRSRTAAARCSPPRRAR